MTRSRAAQNGSAAAKIAEPHTAFLAAQNAPAPQIITGQNVHDWKGTTPVRTQALEDTRKFEVREEFRGAEWAATGNVTLPIPADLAK